MVKVNSHRVIDPGKAAMRIIHICGAILLASVAIVSAAVDPSKLDTNTAKSVPVKYEANYGYSDDVHDYGSYDFYDYESEQGACVKRDNSLALLPLPTPAKILQAACVLTSDDEKK